MATTEYCTAEQVSSRLSPDATRVSTNHDMDIARAVTVACRWIDQHTGRWFAANPASTTRKLGVDCARYDRTLGCWTLATPDMVSITTVGLDLGDSNAFTTYTTADYYTLPLSGVKGTYSSWPTETLVFPDLGLRETGRYPLAQITAVFGWAAVPDQVEECAIEVASWLVQRRDTKLGLADFGAAGLARARAAGLFVTIDDFVKVGGLGLGGFA